MNSQTIDDLEKVSLDHIGDFRDSRHRISIQSVHPALVPGSREI